MADLGNLMTSDPTLDRLNSEVTAAILAAEHLPKGSPDASTAWLEVAFAEEALSAFTAPRSVEGEICRRGAITAALKAGSVRYAEGLARGYLSEDLADSTRQTIKELHQLARAAVMTNQRHPDAS